MKKNKGKLHKTFSAAKLAVKNQEWDKARNLYDYIIYSIAEERLDNDVQVDDKIEDVKVGVWLERAWYGLENNDLLL